MRRAFLWCVLAWSLPAWSQADGGFAEVVAPADAGMAEAVDAGVPAPVAPPTPVVTAPPPPAASKPAPPPPAPKEEAPSPPLFDFEWAKLLPMTPALSSMYYDLSAVYAAHHFAFPEGGMNVTGLRFVERNSGLGKMTMYVVTQLLLALGEGAAAANGKYVGSSYGVGYRVDYYQRYSQAELDGMRRAREQAGDDMLQSNMSLDLQLYLPMEGRSTASGLSVEITPVTVEFTDDGTLGLEVAFAWTKLTDVTPGAPGRLRAYENLGVPLRLMANWKFLNLVLQWTPNIFGGFGISPKEMEKNYLASLDRPDKAIFYNNSPWSLALSLHPLRNLFVRATGYWTKYELSLNALGYQLEAGLRF